MRLPVFLAAAASISYIGLTESFTSVPTFTTRTQLLNAVDRIYPSTRLHVGGIPDFVSFRGFDDDDDDDEKVEGGEEDEEDDEEPDAYAKAAPSEFLEAERGSLLAGPVTRVDWGGEYGKLRERFSETESGRTTPSTALFRIMTSETPNQAISKFVRSANPQVVQAMAGAVNGLLGGLSNPVMGVETLVKASGDKIANLCFQLQMTGYMFRNAEYVLALKDLMKLRGSASLQEYKDAFNKLDRDGSGFIESVEIERLLQDVYQDAVPRFEVENFLNFFDSNNDGKISWEEFERGLGAITAQDASKRISGLLPGSTEGDDDDDDIELPNLEPNISGTLKIELKNGKVIELEAKDYIANLKKEAEALKAALRQESGTIPISVKDATITPGSKTMSQSSDDSFSGALAGYIASREGDVKSLTDGISTDIVETMKKLVDFVLKGSNTSNKIQTDVSKLEMEIPGSALQQLALWQLVLGYKLREAEATGEYLKLLQ